MKTPARIRVLLCFAALFLSSCSAQGPVFDEAALANAEGAAIVLYRPHRSCMRGTLVSFTLDKGRAVSLSDKGYAVIPVLPGEHTVVAAELPGPGAPALSATVSLEKGGRRYLKYDIQCFGKLFLLESPRFAVLFHEVPEKAAQEDLSELRQEGPPVRAREPEKSTPQVPDDASRRKS